MHRGLRFIFLPMFWYMTLACGFAADENAHQQGVLVLYSDARILPAVMVTDEILRTAVGQRQPGKTAYYNEFLDVVRFPSAESQQRFADFLHDKYRDQHIDVIVAVRDAAFEFALRQRGIALPKVPILHMAVGQATLTNRQLPDDVVGLPMEIDATPAVSLVHRLHPQCAQLVIVAGDSDLDRQWIAAYHQALDHDPTPVRWLIGLSLEELEQETAALPATSVLLFGALYRDRFGHTQVPADATKRLARVSAAPIYVCYSTMIGEGAVGGSVFDMPPAARQTGAALLRLLAGEAPSSLGLPHIRPDSVVLDWRQVERWKIPERLIPPDAQIQHRDATFWESYRGWILLAAAVFAMQAVLISALTVNHFRLKRERSKVADEQQRMELATAAAKLGAWVWDITKDEMWANDSCRRLFGIGLTEPISRAGFTVCIHPDDRVANAAALAAVLASGKTYDHEFRVLLPDGSIRWIVGFGHLERDVKGQPRRLLGIAKDISERKLLRLQTERQQNELAHLSRVSSLGELSSSIAHELNQPLAAILSNAQAALRFLDWPEPDLVEIRAILGDIARQDMRAGEVIRRMRAMLRKDKPNLVDLDLRQVAEDALAMVRSDLVARNVVCVTSLGEQAWLVCGDRVQLQQVLINLVINAGDAMADQPQERRRLVVSVGAHDDRIRCTVVDHGHGIPAHDLERIFEAFVSTKAQGIGMGLSICRSIVTAHGGTLVARNNPDGGATFCLELPQAAVPAPAPAMPLAAGIAT